MYHKESNNSALTNFQLRGFTPLEKIQYLPPISPISGTHTWKKKWNVISLKTVKCYENTANVSDLIFGKFLTFFKANSFPRCNTGNINEIAPSQKRM